MKKSDYPQTVVKRVHHIYHVLVRLVFCLKVAQSSYHFLHFGLPFLPFWDSVFSSLCYEVVRLCTNRCEESAPFSSHFGPFSELFKGSIIFLPFPPLWASVSSFLGFR